VFLTAAAYHALAEATDAPLHLGVTEAGALRAGTVKSSIAMGSLLWAGIGDTIRVSLAADPVEEIKVGNDLLKSLGLRQRGVTSSRARRARVRGSTSSRRSMRWKSASRTSRSRSRSRSSAAS
jgi:4-hydroxy-3-methylbut-2-en-1-yl diphosphate synthase IspG/GcpE